MNYFKFIKRTSYIVFTFLLFTDLAFALKCASPRFQNMIPETANKGIHPQANIQFMVTGYGSFKKEPSRQKYYKLMAKDDLNLPINVSLLGNLVIIRLKKGILKSNSSYRLEYTNKLEFGTGPKTHFKTGNQQSLPPLPKNIEFKKVKISDASEHLAANILFKMKEFEILSDNMSSLFHWELQVKNGKEWKTIQGAPLVHIKSYGKKKLTPNSSLRINIDRSNSMCTYRPFIKSKNNYQFRVQLVRSDGQKRTSKIKDVTLK